MSTIEPPPKKSTREGILDAAAQLFLEQTDEVRLEDIAQRAGVSRQSLYVHFGSRTGLLLAMVQHLDETGANILEHVQSLVDAPSGLDALDIAAAAPAGYYPMVYPIAKLFMAGRYEDAAMKAAWDDRMLARRRICATLVGRLEEDGVLAPEWTLEAATDALWVLTSWQVWEQLVVDQGWSAERYTEYLRTMIRRMLVDSRK